MNSERTELQWLAFQYIAGELGPEDSAAFESRLANDQAACEAVAGAVELAEMMALAENRVAAPVAPVISKTKSAWTRRLTWMACSAAACLAFLLVVQPFSRSRLQSDSVVVSGGSQSPELALAWAQTRDAIVVGDSQDAIDVGMSPETEMAMEDSISAPSWMLEAVVGLTPNVEEIE